MIAVTSAADTQPSARLAQQLDPLSLKAALEPAGAALLPGAAGTQDQGKLLASLGGVVSLSAMARTLTAILDAPGTVSAKVLGTQALWPQPGTPDTQALAARLQRTVANSGLFYESHLQQLALGQRSAAQLAQEPQARLNSRQAESSSATLSAHTQDSAQQAPLAVMHPQALALVRQQLDLLAAPQFRWAGEAWPGASMDWEIQEDQSGRQGAANDEPAQRSWTSRLGMTLPSLGSVEARLSILGSTLQLRLAASDPVTVGLLNSAGAELPQRFDALGLQLTALQIASLASEPVPTP